MNKIDWTKTVALSSVGIFGIIYASDLALIVVAIGIFFIWKD